MIRTLYVVAMLTACEGTPDPHPHPHPHDANATPASSTAPRTSTPPEVALGGDRARLEPSADALTLIVTDSAGVPIAASGEARVQLTGTGEPAQRIVLKPDGASWTGEARAAGAKGYVAVVSVELDGHTESARFTWGEVPSTSHTHGDDPAHNHEAAGHQHGDGADEGHAH